LYQALQRAEAYIKGKDKNQLFQDARWIVNKVFESDKVKENSNFRLFVVGYFHFFYDQGGAGDWCEDVSFALRYDNRPKLSLALRKKINGLIKGLNDGIKAGVKAGAATHALHQERARNHPPPAIIPLKSPEPSIQIIYIKYDNQFLWIVWRTAQGISASPWSNSRLIKVSPAGDTSGSLEHPPYTGTVKWPLDLGRAGWEDCKYTNVGTGTGQLECGN
jgi:hypothetical protein